MWNKTRGKENTKQDYLSAAQDQLISLASTPVIDIESSIPVTAKIIEILSQNKTLSPYTKLAGKSSPFEEALNAENIDLLYAMHKLHPSEIHKPLLEDLASRKLLEEAQSPSPNNNRISFLLDAGADPFLEAPNSKANTLRESLERGNHDSRKPKKMQAFDLLAQNIDNLDALNLIYRKLPKRLEGNRKQYSNTLTNITQQRLQESLLNQELDKQNTKNRFNSFNQIVAEAEKSKLPGIGEYAAELMETRFNKALEKVTYDINDYYNDNPGVLITEDISQELGANKARNLQESNSIEIASDKEFNEYISTNTIEIIDQYANTTADNKYVFLKKQNPTLSYKELLNKFVSKRIQEDIFHDKHPNKILEKSVINMIGEENLESFRNARKEVLSDLEITRYIERKHQNFKTQKVENFLNNNPLLRKYSYHKNAPMIIEDALDNIHNNPQILIKTIEVIKEQNKDDPSIVEDMIKKLVDYSNELASPVRALELHSILKAADLPLPKNYKIGQLSDKEIESLQNFAALTKNTEKTLSGNYSSDEINQLYEEHHKLAEDKLPIEIKAFFRSSLIPSTQEYFNKELKTSKNITKIINNLTEISKNSEVIKVAFNANTSEELSNILTYNAASQIMSNKDKSPKKLHLKKIADHKNKFESEQQKLSAKINMLENEIKGIDVIKPSNLLNSKANSADDLKIYSSDRKKSKTDKETELKNAKKSLDELGNRFHREELQLESELNGETLTNEQKIYDAKLEQFNQFLMQSPNISNNAANNDILTSHVMNIAIENIDRKPELMGQTITLLKEQYTKDNLIEQVEDYKDQLLKDSQYKGQEKELQDYFKEVITLMNTHYVPNKEDGNANLIKKIADIDNFPEISNELKNSITPPSFEKLNELIRAKIHDNNTTPEHKSLLTTALVEKLNGQPPLNIETLQSLHDKKDQETFKQILHDSNPSDISTAIMNTKNNLAKDIYLTARLHKATTPSEAKKLINIALQQNDNYKMLDRITRDIEENKEIISPELLTELYKAGELDRLLRKPTLDHVLSTILENSKNTDPNLICDVLNTTKGMENKKLSQIANIVLNDENKIKQISKENKEKYKESIDSLAPHYDCNNHEPIFLKELIDVHDTSFKENRFDRLKQGQINSQSITNVESSIRLAMTNTKGTHSYDLPKDLAPSLTKYLKTKRSIFKSFFRNQEEKLTKRVGELTIGANAFKMIEKSFDKDKAVQTSLLAAFKESFKELFKKHKKTINLDNIDKKEINRVLKDATSQDIIDPDLATKIFHKAMSLEVPLNTNDIRKLAEIAYNHREKGDSPQLTNSYISKLSELFPNDEFYKQTQAELSQGTKKPSIELESTQEERINQQLQETKRIENETRKTKRSRAIHNAQKPFEKAKRESERAIEDLKNAIKDANVIPSGKTATTNTPPVKRKKLIHKGRVLQ